MSQSIAILGIACRFPGAATVDALRQLLEAGSGAAGSPLGRWDGAAPGPATAGSFLPGIDGFDAGLFGLDDEAAGYLAPELRILMELAWAALEDAGVAPDGLAGSATGVFIGMRASEYPRLGKPPAASPAAAESLASAADRLSTIFGVRGPSLTLDAAGASSLAAVHLACRALARGECDLALAGGVSLLLTPDRGLTLTDAGALAPDGRCKPFDAAADGRCRAEGGAVLVLKRLSDALAEGDAIHGVVRGSALGHGGGASDPSPLVAGMTAALADADLPPQAIALVEAHATGAPAGDAREVAALAAVVGTPGDGVQPCYLGSIKANIGDAEDAAGIAGLIKVLLALGEGGIPPQAHLTAPHPELALVGSRLVLPATRIPWERGETPRLALVNDLGQGGTSVHLVVEEAPTRALPANEPERPVQILALSAASAEALGTLAGGYEEVLAAARPEDLADLCYTANTGRAHLAHRLTAIGATPADLAARIKAYRAGKGDTGVVPPGAPPRVAFLFTGQGSQYAGMGRGLYDTQPVFRDALDACAEVLDRRGQRPLLAVLFPSSPEDAALIDQTAYTQPSLFAVEYALATLWRSFGIEPAVVMGHSVGEYVAACIAGVFSLEDGLGLIAERAARMQALPAGGAMAALLTDPASVLAAIAGMEGVGAAAINGPSNVVISGREAVVDAVMARFAADGVRGQKLAVSHAFHSSLMDPMLDGFTAYARGLSYAAPRLTLISNLTGGVLEAGRVPDADYWRDHIREAVRFSDGVAALAGLGIEVMVEVGPQPVLTGMAKRIDKRRELLWAASLRKGTPDWESMLEGLADLYRRGVPVDWRGFDAPYRRGRRSLPTYPFEHKPYWLWDRGATGRA